MAVLCADTGVVARCQPPCRQERQGVVAWHWDSPVTTCKEEGEVVMEGKEEKEGARWVFMRQGLGWDLSNFDG